ncbi:MAG: TfoX/Sxy family protein [Vicinamibacterales bacterium]
MAVSETVRDFILEQLERAARDVRARRMFGAVGIYAGELFFALIDDDQLYFKVDDTTRPAFIARGMKPFQPYGPAGETMGYYTVPIEVLEDPDALRVWARDAMGVAQRAAATKPRRSKRSPTRRPERL